MFKFRFIVYSISDDPDFHYDHDYRSGFFKGSNSSTHLSAAEILILASKVLINIKKDESKITGHLHNGHIFFIFPNRK